MPPHFNRFESSTITRRDRIPFAGCLRAGAAEPEPGRPVLVGLPDDSQSSFLRGSAAGPARVRDAYDGNSFNASTESGVDLAGAVVDLGDWVSLDSWSATATSYRERAERLWRDGLAPFFIGGDHAVTVPLLEAIAVLDEPVHVIQIDAHGDLYDSFEGSRTSHACTGARALEMKHVVTLTQYGVRTLSPPQREVAERHANRLVIHEARHLSQRALPMPVGVGSNDAVYVTLDLDGFDPAHAPGVSHAVPGGLTSRQVLDFLQAMPGRLVGMDAVEVNPSVDEHDRTAILAARCLHEAMGRLPYWKQFG